MELPGLIGVHGTDELQLVVAVLLTLDTPQGVIMVIVPLAWEEAMKSPVPLAFVVGKTPTCVTVKFTAQLQQFPTN
jgi:hypothetical protein